MIACKVPQKLTLKSSAGLYKDMDKDRIQGEHDLTCTNLMLFWRWFKSRGLEENGCDDQFELLLVHLWVELAEWFIFPLLQNIAIHFLVNYSHIMLKYFCFDLLTWWMMDGLEGGTVCDLALKIWYKNRTFNLLNLLFTVIFRVFPKTVLILMFIMLFGVVLP